MNWWENEDVRRIARAAREDVSLLPILADAIEDAGCRDNSLLGHLRDVEFHRDEVPSCAVPDDILNWEQIHPKGD